MTKKPDPKQVIERDEVAKAVIDVIITEGMVSPEKVTPDATIESLEIESIEFVMILNGLEERFDIYIPVDEEVTDIASVDNLIDEIHRRLLEGDDGSP